MDNLRVWWIVVALLTWSWQGMGQFWTTNLLNKFAVKDAYGEIMVSGTSGSYNDNPERTRKAVFDGDVTTFFDPPNATVKTEACWAAIELQHPMVVSRIRYAGRADYPLRMKGVLFQGSNDANFWESVTLLTGQAISGTEFNDEVVVTFDTLQAFRYFRVIGPNLYDANQSDEGVCAGNASEVEFYGTAPLADRPAPPEVVFADVMNWHANIIFENTAEGMFYELQRYFEAEGEWREVLFLTWQELGAYNWCDPVIVHSTTHYRLRAHNNMGASDWVEINMTPHLAARGTMLSPHGLALLPEDGFTSVSDGDVQTGVWLPKISAGEKAWCGWDLGEVATIAKLRLVPIAGVADAPWQGHFEVADTVSFADPTTIYILDDTLAQELSVLEVDLAEPVSARFIRFVAASGAPFNLAEAEIVITTSRPPMPLDFKISASDLIDNYPVLSWEPVGPYAASLVYRAISPGGPYTLLTPAGVVAGETTFTDATPITGILYYYRVSTLRVEEEQEVEGPPTAALAYRRVERLERDWDNLTTLKPGVTLYYTNQPWDEKGVASNAFDNDTSTYVDLTPSDTARIGVDFGQLCGIGFIRVQARSGHTGRLEESLLYGWNEPQQPFEILKVKGVSSSAFTQHPADNYTPCRKAYLAKAEPSNFYGNLVELEFYGWPHAPVAGQLLAPSSLKHTTTTTGNQLSWNAGANVQHYRVERRLDAGNASWEVLGTTTALTFVDTQPLFDTTVVYRVVAVQGTEEAGSETFTVRCYEPGMGSGLYAAYTAGYTRGYQPTKERVVSVMTNATVNFNWGVNPIVATEPDTTRDTYVAWQGALVVPRAGNLSLRIVKDGGAALRLDDQWLINDWGGEQTTVGATRFLEAGVYPMRLDYLHVDTRARVRLEWDLPGFFEVIPASQLLPGAPSPLTSEWQGRTFNAPILGFHSWQDGVMSIDSGGADLSETDRGYYVWQTMRGPFVLEALVTQHVQEDYPDAKAFLLMRAGAESGSPMIAAIRMASDFAGGHLGVKARLEPAGTLASRLQPSWQHTVANPIWLRLKRKGNHFACWYRIQAEEEWQLLYEYTDTSQHFGPGLQVGFGVAASAGEFGLAELQRASFSKIRLYSPEGTLFLIP